MTNFGLEPFLRTLVELAPHPHARPSDTGIVEPTDERFTGFVFKIQANMDPRHRDRVAFVRVCSGKFTKDMAVSNSRAGKLIRATRAYRFFGRDRETITEAYAGDIIGLVNPGQFAIGDTVHTGAPLKFLDIPRFPPEHFGRLRLQDTRYKQFDDGLRQLEEEGLMQVFYVESGRREPIVGVVGALQFDVIKSRLRDRVRRRDRRRSVDVHRRALGRRSRPSRCRCSAARRPPRSIASTGACCCSPTSGKCSTSRSRTRRSACSPNRRSRERRTTEREATRDRAERLLA